MLDRTPEVLLIEDNLDDAAITIHSLKKSNPNATIELVRDGATALDFLFSAGNYARRPFGQVPDLIILDMRLPKATGLEVLRVIKFYVRTRAIPVVVFTAVADERVMQESRQLMVSDYVVKPTAFEQFRDAVQQIAAQWLPATSDQTAPHVIRDSMQVAVSSVS